MASTCPQIHRLAPWVHAIAIDAMAAATNGSKDGWQGWQTGFSGHIFRQRAREIDHVIMSMSLVIFNKPLKHHLKYQPN